MLLVNYLVYLDLPKAVSYFGASPRFLAEQSELQEFDWRSSPPRSLRFTCIHVHAQDCDF